MSTRWLSDDELATFLAQKPAGDLTGRFFDDDGLELGLPTSERVIAVTLDDLRRVPCVIGLAAGLEKARGVLASLHTGVVDVVVLDLPLARAVLSRAGEPVPAEA